MKELLDKISSYNLFNYLFPGVLFVIMSKEFTNYNFVQQNEILGVFLYYFIGMIISRVGSLIIEPILKKTSFIKFSDYKNFISASKKDEKIELFSEINNTYRTIIAMMFLLIILKGYNYLETFWNISKTATSFMGMILLLVMFLFSYNKQTNYITKRIDAANK